MMPKSLGKFRVYVPKQLEFRGCGRDWSTFLTKQNVLQHCTLMHSIIGFFAASVQFSLETDTCIVIEKHDPWSSDCQLYFIYRRKLVAKALPWTTWFCRSLPPGSCCRGQQSNNTHHRWHACHNGESRWHRICRCSLWQRLTRKYFWMCFVSLCWLWSISWNFPDM